MKQLLNINNRAKRIRFAQEKKAAGMSVYEIALALHSSPKTIKKYLNIDLDITEDHITAREARHRLAIEQKQKDVDEARGLAKKGIPIEQIAKELHHTHKTIQNYLNPDYSIVNGHYNMRIPNKLAHYEAEVIELRSKGVTYPKIYELISNKGYDGSVSSLRMFMQKERLRHANDNEMDINFDYQPTEYVQRKSLSHLIYK